jgi:hypothetical protein
MTDIFLWANQADSMKKGLQCELFLFNKNAVLYSLRVSPALEIELPMMFLYGIINEIQTDAAIGVNVVNLVDYDKRDSKQLPYLPLSDVDRVRYLVRQIEEDRAGIFEFSTHNHEFKRMKGIVAHYTHPDDKNVSFYVAKYLPPSASISVGHVWDFDGGNAESHLADVTVNMPMDNQMLIVGGEIFIFDQSKFAKAFDYNIQDIRTSDEIGEAISNRYSLILPNMFNDFAVMARESKSTLKRLLEVNTESLPSQETVLDIADNMAIELMTDDKGNIILFDTKDANKFLDIVNDNYLSSETGNHYLVKSKKPLEIKSNEECIS